MTLSFVETELEVVRERIEWTLQTLQSGSSTIDQTDHAVDGDHPVAWLHQRLQLSAAELRIVWVLLAHELCPRTRSLIRDLNTEACADPTTASLRLAAFGPGFHSDATRLLAANSRLVRLGLIERTDKDSSPEHRATWKVARRVVTLAHNDLSLDPTVAGLVREPPTDHGIDNCGIEADAVAVAKLQQALTSHDLAAITVVHGPSGIGRSSLLRQMLTDRGLKILEIDLRRASNTLDEVKAQARAIALECHLFRHVLLLHNLDALDTRDERLEIVLATLQGLHVYATCSKPIAGNRVPNVQLVELPPITNSQRALLWQRALHTSGEQACVLAAAYPISPRLIASVARFTQDETQIRISLRTILDDQLSNFAKRVDTSEPSPLILPDDQGELVMELISRVQQRTVVYESWGLGSATGRGMGVSALFSGPPGTGKTMAAGLIAEELGTDLYQVDMSKITSKWLGETEQNLAKLFDAAEAGHAILLFDEADALFGKRTEVRSSNDRHANQETNYLLQRLESFRGVCILTTNHDSAIDAAFRRRLTVHIQFSMPDLSERVRLWESMVRVRALPISGDFDFRHLAQRFEMSGGHIRNAVIRAAFKAAHSGQKITQQLLLRAAQIEYATMGRISN